MTVLDTLNFFAFKLLQNNNPIAVRRRKLIAKIDEQIQFAANKDYTPTQHKWVTDEHGNQRKVEVAKRVKRWWTASVDGKINLVVRYGSKPLLSFYLCALLASWVMVVNMTGLCLFVRLKLLTL